MKFTVTADTNFIRIFQMPQEFPSDFCFQGGHDVNFNLVDWFNPIDQMSFWGGKEIVLQGEYLEEKRDKIARFIKTKKYFDHNFKYLAMTDYGDVFIIQDESLRLKEESDREKIAKMIDDLRIIDKWAGEIKGAHKKGQTANGNSECPVCKGDIAWSLHSNGHLWARCKTADCVNFTE